MKKQKIISQFKPILTSITLSLLSVQAFAIPLALGKVHHPIHYKPPVKGTSFLPTSGLSPLQVRNAYGFNDEKAQGEGQIIAIVDAFDDPKIEHDLGVFNRQFGLPACTTRNGLFKKIYANGTRPATDAGWSGEIALDVEWAHAIAPKAKIILVEAASDSTQDLYQAIQVAVKHGANVVSMSWGAPEYDGQTEFDPIFNNPNVTFTASSGDSGTGTIHPASSPYVIAVGGTTLTVDSYGNYQGESAWSGSGGGISTVETWPAYQSGLPIPLANDMRGVPDVSYNADPQTGFSVFNSIPGPGGAGWEVIGGTSAGAPQWAALVAVANSAVRGNIGGQLNTLLYSLANPTSGLYDYVFNDIRGGTNGSCGYYCTAQLGYDFVTGLGSPQFGNLMNEFRIPQFQSLAVK